MGDVAEIIKEWDGWKEIVGKYFAMHGQYMSSLKHNLVSLTLILNYLTVLKVLSNGHYVQCNDIWLTWPDTPRDMIGKTEAVKLLI